MQWQKCPSVTTGGKPYFWFARGPSDGLRWWVVWDRRLSTWVARNDIESDPTTFASPAQAKRFVDAMQYV